MNVPALKELRRVIENAPRDLFHMRAIIEQAPCGTARCAIGWAACDPWFRAHTNIWATTDPKLWGKCIEEAAQTFVLSEDDTNYLFGGALDSEMTDPHAVSPEEVLWNIDELLAGRHARPYRATNEYPVEACVPIPSETLECIMVEDRS